MERNEVVTTPTDAFLETLRRHTAPIIREVQGRVWSVTPAGVTELLPPQPVQATPIPVQQPTALVELLTKVGEVKPETHFLHVAKAGTDNGSSVVVKVCGRNHPQTGKRETYAELPLPWDGFQYGKEMSQSDLMKAMHEYFVPKEGDFAPIYGMCGNITTSNENTSKDDEGDISFSRTTLQRIPEACKVPIPATLMELDPFPVIPAEPMIVRPRLHHVDKGAPGVSLSRVGKMDRGARRVAAFAAWFRKELPGWTVVA